MIKAIKFSGFLLASLYNILLQVNVAPLGDLPTQDTIQWSPYYRLQLDDFEAKPDKNSSHAAITATGINYYLIVNPDNTVSFNTEAVFYKKESWLNKELIDNYNYALKHEQGHFDIAEVYAKRLLVALNKFYADTTNRSVDIQNVYDEIITAQQSMQQLYDKETEHSTNARKQYEWNKKIHAMLNERDID